MPVLVWVDEWALACCGDVFGVGDSVDWLCTDPELTWLGTVLPHDVAQRISLAENSHGTSGDENRVKRGTVVEIHAAFVRYAGSGPYGNVLTPVPGTTFLREVAHVSETDMDGAGASLCGYVVTLDALPAHG